MEQWLTFREIADELGIPVKSIYHYVRTGEGPTVHRFGKHLRVRRTDLTAWESSRQVST